MRNSYKLLIRNPTDHVHLRGAAVCIPKSKTPTVLLTESAPLTAQHAQDYPGTNAIVGVPDTNCSSFFVKGIVVSV